METPPDVPPAFNGHTVTVSCPECKVPVRISYPHIDLVRFPQDDDKTVGILARRLHVHRCPACLTTTSVFVPLIVLHQDMARVLVAVPESVADETRRLLTASAAKLGQGIQVTVCHSYAALYRELAPWVNEILMPLLQKLLAPDSRDRHIDPDTITRLIVMLFHAQAEGMIEPFVRIEQDGRSIDGRALMRKMHVGLGTAHG
jgi:hypothetical protein